MKRIFNLFVLTTAEQRVVIALVLLLVAGAWFKHIRDRASLPAVPSSTPLVSPSPNER